MNWSEARDSRPSTTNSNTCKHMKTLDGNLAVFLFVVPSDEEKGRQMWRKYLEREDSRIGGKYIDKEISASVTHFCSRSHGDHSSQGTLLSACDSQN